MAIQNRVPVPSSTHELIANTSDGINQSLEIPVKVPRQRSFWRLMAAVCFCLSSSPGRTYEVSPVDDRSRLGSTTPGKRKTLVLDLDETLVHSSVTAIPDPDYVFTVETQDEKVPIYVLIRPGLQEFLERAKQHYDIIVYTASVMQYADPLLDVLDYKRLIDGRLFRDDCVLIDGTYTKDLIRLDKDMSTIIIVDVRNPLRTPPVPIKTTRKTLFPFPPSQTTSQTQSCTN